MSKTTLANKLHPASVVVVDVVVDELDPPAEKYTTN